MKPVVSTCLAASMLYLTIGCASFPQYRPIERTPSAGTPADSTGVTVFLLERDLPSAMERIGTITIHTFGSIYSVHQQVEDELQKTGRLKGANGAIRIQHGTYDHDKDGLVTYLLFRYTK
ncbi:hypothetical protein [Fibrivirga algicola]|jgi:hypothetical protein|uniref:Lipoprotein n=1 Tax=Fibrivirga algicola TaxID=2950420 RepID=A0ABX0QS36_9BACT|nr:hypothetical protein [Fibrivirga algicola]NID13573.1 hypothetical protein [Fibrivirga algicola]